MWTVSLTAIVLGIAAQVTAVTSWRLTERRNPAIATAARGLLTGASWVVALGCLALVLMVLPELGEAGHECAQLGRKGARNVSIALAVTLVVTAALSLWAGRRSKRAERCGAALGWEVGAGSLAFLLFVWLAGGTSC
jgi:hypothetical protein